MINPSNRLKLFTIITISFDNLKFLSSNRCKERNTQINLSIPIYNQWMPPLLPMQLKL